MAHYFCKKCGENSAVELEDFLCYECNPKNWEKGDNLVAISDSQQCYYLKGDVFTFDRKNRFEGFSPKENVRVSYDRGNFKLYKKEKETNISVGDEVRWGHRRPLEVVYICKDKSIDRIDTMCWDDERKYHLVIDIEELEKIPPEPKFEINDEVIIIKSYFGVEKKGVIKYITNYINEVYRYVIEYECDNGYKDTVLVSESYLKEEGGN